MRNPKSDSLFAFQIPATNAKYELYIPPFITLALPGTASENHKGKITAKTAEGRAHFLTQQSTQTSIIIRADAALFVKTK